ncbi:MAG: ATP-dependent Clp protease ATP-binding subunit, partial [Eubacterium sp.]|nr:ATP-dependent Clp protease ATP-binding subunit [Eubacterium sp.]
MENDKAVPEGLCIKCARELNIGSINQMIDKMGISDEELEMASEQMANFMENMGDFDFGSLGEMFNPDNMDGAQTMPFADLFGGTSSNDGENPDTKGKRRPKKGKKNSQDETRKFLNTYCNNLTDRAKQGKIDNIIGRESEISRAIQILCRRTKNNPCLIGEPGVGKTAIAEGLAIRIAKGQVPARLADKEIYLLDLTALVAGTQFRGQFEGRIKGLVDEVKHEGNIILFIDEVHNLVGTGDSEGTM